MSAFLGPIHYWLFNKILRVEGRAFAMASAMESNGKAEIARSKIEEYGQRLAGADLAELVEGNSIHQSLYGLISKVEVFEASLVEAAGDDYEIVKKAAEENGKEAAEKAVAKEGARPEDLESIYRFINDSQLEGMPCDPGAEVEPLDANRLAYRHIACNHISNWEYTNCPSSKMCGINNAWLKGFISGLNGDAEYTVEKTIADGAESCEAEIRLS